MKSEEGASGNREVSSKVPLSYKISSLICSTVSNSSIYSIESTSSASTYTLLIEGITVDDNTDNVRPNTAIFFINIIITFSFLKFIINNNRYPLLFIIILAHY